MDAQDRERLAALLSARRWAALATVDADGAPRASHVAVGIAPGGGGLLLHLSRLAAHTRNLLERPRASLAIGEADDGRLDPQTLGRLALHGEAAPIARDDAGYQGAREAYLARFPAATARFQFGDFDLFCVSPRAGRYVGGFGRAHTLAGDSLRDLLGVAARRREH